VVDSTINTGFKFDNSYVEQLTGFYVPFIGEKAPEPQLIKLNRPLAEELGLDLVQLGADDIAKMFSGNILPNGATPVAQVYAGHQFGSFSPQLGDGRALLLGEVIDDTGVRRDIHLKGSGRTAFSRGGDGKAALGPMLREYIISEAMFALNIPTTRALAVVGTGEKVIRDSGLLSGAVLARVAASHIRVGTFQYFAARHETDKIKQLADYTIQRHFPALLMAFEKSESKNEKQKESESPYLGLISEVRDRQASLLARWMLSGFIHGVMNTDNMTISGETIDYGPCAFMDSYDPETVFSSIDRQGRYAYANQPPIAQWNLARLAETLLPFIHSDLDTAIELATHEINIFSERYQQFWLEGMRFKLGLSSEEADDSKLANELLQSMEGQDVDFTLLFRRLADSLRGDIECVRDLFDDYEKFDQWYARWQERLARESTNVEDRIISMNQVNPIYIPRNHKVEEALFAAEAKSDFAPFEKLVDVLASPFEEREGLETYAEPAPDSFLPYRTFCGT